MLKKFLATASVVGLVAGAANALEVRANTAGADAVGEPTVLAAELPYSTTGVSASGSDLSFEFYPTGGTFPTGNVLLRVEVSGATFSSALTGAEVTTPAPGTSVISTDGQADASVVTFLLSDVSACNNTGNCFVDLPLDLSGSNVSVSVGLETDAGAPIDNSSLDNLTSEALVVVAPAFDINIVADTVTSNAQLGTLFTTLTDNELGTVDVVANTVAIGLNNRTVNTDLAGTDVAAGDVTSIEVVVEGLVDAFASATINGPAAIDTDESTITDTLAFAGGPYSVVVTPDGTTAIERSDYDATVTVTHGGAALVAGTTVLSGALESIGREGAEVTFPWTQSATQGEASGATSVFRIGNLSSTASGAVFVDVRNSSEAGFTNPGIVQIASGIDANGELVVNSAQIEAAVGNYGRGDVRFTIEAQAGALTGRQFVVRNGNIQQVVGGTIQQDLN